MELLSLSTWGDKRMLQSMRFKVYMGPVKMSFAKISGFQKETSTFPLQEGGVNDYVYSLRAPNKAEKVIVFERGYAFARSEALALFSPGERVIWDILIVMEDSHGDMVRTMALTGCFVKKYTLGELDAMSSNVVVERFEVTCQTIEML